MNLSFSILCILLLLLSYLHFFTLYNTIHYTIFLNHIKNSLFQNFMQGESSQPMSVNEGQ